MAETQRSAHVADELNDKPPIGRELGSSFSYDDVFGGWENGKVFALPRVEDKDYFEMIETDGKAASIEILLAYPIISAPWEIEPFKEDSGQAEFIYDALTNLPHQGGSRTTIETLVSQMTSAFTYHHAFFEKVFRVNDEDKVVYDKLAWRPNETCELMLDDKNAEVRGFRQYPVVWGPKPFVSYQGKGHVDIKLDRAFIYTHGIWKDPIFGFSSMKVPYWCYITKRKLRWLWYQFLDETMLPKAVVQNPDGVEAVAHAKAFSKLRSKGVIGLPTDTTVAAYESSGKGAEGYLEAIRFLDSEMSNSVLGGFMDLTSSAGDGKGSFALAENTSRLFLRTRRMVARDMARSITNDIIGPLIRYNYGIKAPVPRFTFGALSEQNEQSVLDMFKSVATTGAKVDPEFYDELQGRVATLLELDEGKVQKSMEEAAATPGDQTPGDLQKLAAQTEIATNMVSEAQARGEIEQRGGPAPGSGGQNAGGRQTSTQRTKSQSSSNRNAPSRNPVRRSTSTTGNTTRTPTGTNSVSKSSQYSNKLRKK